MLLTETGNLCGLCFQNELDNTGAHIMTDSLIRSAISVEGSRGRNREALHTISIDRIGLSYFGRDVIPEIRAQFLNDDPSVDADLSMVQNNPFIDANLVCRTCEKKFSQIENEFISKVTQPLRTGNYQNWEGGVDATKFSHYLYSITELFVQINLWRCSASSKSKVKLPQDKEIELGSYLNTILKPSIANTLQMVKQNRGQISGHNFCLFWLDQQEGQDSENFVFAEDSVHPFVIIANRLVIIYSVDNFTSVQPPRLISQFIDINVVLRVTREYPEILIVPILSNEGRLGLYKAYILDYAEYLIYELAPEMLTQLMQDAFAYECTGADLQRLEYNIRSSISQNQGLRIGQLKRAIIETAATIEQSKQLQRIQL